MVQRESVSREIKRILQERAGFFNITMDDVSITQVGTQAGLHPLRLSCAGFEAQLQGHATPLLSASDDRAASTVDAISGG